MIGRADSGRRDGDRDHDRDDNRRKDRQRDSQKERQETRESDRDWRDRGRERDRDRQHGEHGPERGRERRGGDESEGRDRERERARHREDRVSAKSSRDERGKDERHRRRDRRGVSDRSQDHHNAQDREQRNDNVYSTSKEKSRNRSRSPSGSPSKSKRTSGFDMAPGGSSLLPVVSPIGLLPNIPQPPAGLFSSLFPFPPAQFGSIPMIPAQAMTQQATRHARRVYVGGLPPLANEQTIATFFSQVMTSIGGNTAGPGDAVVNVYINHEKKFAFVEMRSVEEASNAMALDGIIFEGVSVRVRRPTDYNPSLAATLGPSQPNPNLNLAAVGLLPGAVGGAADGPDRIFIGGLPYYLTEAQIKELLESFGPLRGFDLVKDRDTGNSKGYGFCVYQDPSVTDIACAALNGLKMADKTLTVRRATASTGQVKSEHELILQQAQQQIALQKMALQATGAPFSGVVMGSSNASVASPTKIVCLIEAVAMDDLKDDDEYEEILEDMREESQKFGRLVRVVIPRPNPGVEEIILGVGKVFLEYDDTAASSRAKAALHGRKFGENVVTAMYYPEDKYNLGDYGAAGTV